MHKQRLLIAVFASAGFAATATAQRAGNVEIGGFGQYTIADGAWQVNSGFGLGGRLGVFLTNRLALEADASFSTFDNKASRGSGSSDQQTFAGRFSYFLPFGWAGRTHHLIAFAGAGGQRFNGHSDFSFSPGGGVRFGLTDRLGLRFDGLVEYVENPTAAGFGFPPGIGVNSQAARSTNVEIRGGLSFFLGKKAEKPAPPPPPVVAEAPPPRQEPPPPQREVQPQAEPDRSGIIRDSLAAVDRAREAVLAKLYFDLDRSELKDDQKAVLDAKIPVLQANPGVRIRIEGNADERGSDEYNMALGMRRAETARQYLVARGIDASRIEISSNGEEKPVCQEKDESCWSQNRRDEFVITAGGATLVAPK